MMSPWLIWTAILHTAKLSTVLQILLFLPLTLVTLSRQAFLLLSLLLSIHALIHGTMGPSVHPWILTAIDYYGIVLTHSGPLFIALEGLSSLLVAQKLGQIGKRLVAEGESYQFTYVVSAWWIVMVYPAAATSPISATLIGAALTAFCFLTFIGFILRRTNIIESSCLGLFIAYNVWLIGFDKSSFTDPASSYAPLLPNLLPHLETLLNFVTNTLPKPVLVGLMYRLTILHLASRILPTIGADSWESADGDDDGVWDPRPTGPLTKLFLTYRQFLFVTVYSHLLLLDSSQQAWSRWLSVIVTLVIWSVELLVSGDDDDDELGGKQWKID
ncbi:hypothetical protein DL96DRAFT_1573659 [Flagelloscypha sp. PMI_526]|nr:hypothetical protein DL96DRAFT_1573659 [Flagelloscypha sp. PMI_526]